MTHIYIFVKSLAEGASRIAFEGDSAEGHGEGVEGEESVGQEFTEAGQVFDGFEGLQGADYTGQCTEGAGRSKVAGLLGGLFAENAAVTS